MLQCCVCRYERTEIEEWIRRAAAQGLQVRSPKTNQVFFPFFFVLFLNIVF